MILAEDVRSRVRREGKWTQRGAGVEEMANSKDRQRCLDELEAKLEVSDDILEQMNSKDRQEILDKLEAKLEVSDDVLEQMNRGEFRNWIDIVTEGIACLADDSLEAKAGADRETDKSRSELDLLDDVRQTRERYIAEWHKGWQTAEIQALVATSNRPRCKANFKIIEKALGLCWFLVSAGHASSMIQKG